MLSGRYLQYRAILDSSDKKAQCTYPSQQAGALPCSPEVQAVQPQPQFYDPLSPSITNTQGLPFNNVTSLSLTTAGCSAGVGMTFSPDGSRWFYYNGGAWVASNNSATQSTSAASLTAAVMGNLAAQVGTGTLYFTAFLFSSAGQTPCALSWQQRSVN